ncbi:receptor-type tyrosine-protein phosphatase eta-like [Sinocyclocheilus grahami]|uniref:receptor-type tyrosine-protein phosphatase eta-like n=1 Tax=Sinocyclocheilus grahami TaxID=75366 RepID=UPI0007AD1941|nr:PREDICTED: receptor-type tyrosine-protein phosphatase eta-like [Sinocyclocheilus grahami]
MHLTADDITTSSVFLNWTKPNGQSSRYRVEYEDKNVMTENTSININDLIPGAQYTFRVFAVAADHVTEGRANQISLYTKPDVISNFTVSKITTSSMFLTWAEPFGNRSFFKLNWTDENLDLNRNAIETNNTSYHISGLTAGVSYTFCITAVAADQSTEGETVCISNYTRPNVVSLAVSEITSSSVFLSWDEPVGNRSFFKVQWADDKTDATNNTSYHITGLTAGVSYTFCITAVAADQSTEGETFCISNYTKPDVIENLIVLEITTSSWFLTWDEPSQM